MRVENRQRRAGKRDLRIPSVIRQIEIFLYLYACMIVNRVSLSKFIVLHNPIFVPYHLTTILFVMDV